MKKLFHSRRIAKTLLCAITALTIGTNAQAQVAIFYDSPIPKSTIKGYKPIMPEYETPLESYEQSYEDKTSPVFSYSIAKIFFFEKISENDFLTENGDTVFVAKDDKETTHPIPNIGIYTLGAYLNEKTTENDQVMSEEYDGSAAFEFSISQDGTVSDVKNVGTSGYISKDFIDITISSITNMPKWTPATKGGVPVESKCGIIINTNCRFPTQAQVVVEGDPIPVPRFGYTTPFKGYKTIAHIADDAIMRFQTCDDDEKAPVLSYAQLTQFYEKFSDKDRINETGDTVFVANDSIKAIAPKPHCGALHCLSNVLFHNISEDQRIYEEEYDGGITIFLTINKDGSTSVDSSEIRRYVNPNFVLAAMEAVRNLPNWTPATRNGEPIDTKCRIGINAVCRIPLTDNLAQSTQGFYKLDKIGREDGSIIDSPFDQYIISTDGYHLDFTITPPSYNSDIMNITITRKAHNIETCETEPAVEPAKEEWLATPPTPMAYDIDKNGFTLKWFNNLKWYGGGPYNSWITETWKRNKSSKAFKDIMEVLKAKPTEENPMLGIWRCKDPDSHEPSDFYKIYGKNHSIILWNNAGEWTLKKFSGTMNGNVRDVEYIHKNLTIEAGAPCMIEWDDDNNFRLHYRDSESSIEQEDSWYERNSKLKLTVEEWERVSADDNNDIYEIIQDIINCK